MDVRAVYFQDTPDEHVVDPTRQSAKHASAHCVLVYARLLTYSKIPHRLPATAVAVVRPGMLRGKKYVILRIIIYDRR